MLEKSQTSKSDPGVLKVLNRLGGRPAADFWSRVGGTLKSGYLNWLESGGLEEDNKGFRMRQISQEQRKVPLRVLERR